MSLNGIDGKHHSLYCVSPKGEEFIANFMISDKQYDFRDKIVIKDYAKDFMLFITSTNYAQLKLLPTNESDTKSLIKFGKYLHQRQKAGIFYMNGDQNESTLSSIKSFVMPPQSSDQPYLLCSVKKNTGLSIGVNISHTSVASSSSSSKVSNDHIHAIAKKEINVNNNSPSVKVLNHVQMLEDNIKDRLKVFDTTSTINSINFPPMDKSDRYIVHDIIQFEYPDLLAASVGDGEERYCIVYRKGYEPDELAGSTAHLILGDNKNDVQIIQARKTSTAKQVNTNYNKAPIAALSQLAPVKTIKRDRRSTDEILQEIKRNKQLAKEEQSISSSQEQQHLEVEQVIKDNDI